MNLFDNSSRSKALALLIDPDKTVIDIAWIRLIKQAQPDYILVGGSQPFAWERLEHTITELKKNTHIPIVGFPGDINQIHAKLDALLALSVIQSYDYRFIFQPIMEVIDFVENNNITCYYTPYLIVQNTGNTSVEKVLGGKLDKILSQDDLTKYLKILKLLNPSCIYIEAGSGAQSILNPDWVVATRSLLPKPYWIVGGGIRTKEQAFDLWNAGADCLVVGNAVEDSPEFLIEICQARDFINSELK